MKGRVAPSSKSAIAAAAWERIAENSSSSISRCRAARSVVIPIQRTGAIDPGSRDSRRLVLRPLQQPALHHLEGERLEAACEARAPEDGHDHEVPFLER